MAKQDRSAERTGHNLTPDTDRPGTDEQKQTDNEAERHQADEQARERAGGEARPGGGGHGKPREATPSARARTVNRLRHAGRVRDEMGGSFGKTK